MKGMPKAVWLILLVALVLRVWVGEELTDRLPRGTDGAVYLGMADSIAGGDGFPPRPFDAGAGPSALTSPGYPYVLGGVRAILGESEVVVRALQALLGTLTVALIGLITWQVFRDRAIALAGLTIAALYPALVVISGPVMTESLFLPLMLGAVAAALRQREVGGLGWAAAAGALAGGAALSKSVGLIAAAVIIAAMWPRPRLARPSLAGPAIALGVLVMVMAPWTIRNAIEFDTFVPGSNELGFGIAGAFNEQTREDPDHEWLPPAQLPQFSTLITDPDRTESEVSRELTRRSIEFALDHPGYPFTLALRNAARMAQVRPSGPTEIDAELYGFGVEAAGRATFSLAYWASALGFLALVALVIVSIARGHARRVPVFLAVLAVLAVLPLLLIAGGPRFRLPGDVLLIVFAAPAAAWLATRLPGSARRSP
jgi:4-amino-4-deoxy-L-arabinose transferase-like glycosyltransferase